MILVTGRGTSGSWQIRGEQMGRAIGATVIPQALDVAGYDLAIIVKRAPDDLLQRLRRADVKIVWDIVDGWTQPAGNRWGRDECMAWLRSEVKRIRPVGLVAATKAMAKDCAEFGLPVLALPHHARPGQEVNPIRDADHLTVGYEGSLRHLGAWAGWLSEECVRRNWRFVPNPASLCELDIVVALREATGYSAMHWKSNIKLANAQATGTPIVCSSEAGYKETATGAERFVATEADVARAFTDLEPYALRSAIGRQMRRADVSLKSAAAAYDGWLTANFGKGAKEVPGLGDHLFPASGHSTAGGQDVFDVIPAGRPTDRNYA